MPQQGPTESLFTVPKHVHSWVGKMAQAIRVLAAKPDDLSSNPSSHVTEGEN